MLYAIPKKAASGAAFLFEAKGRQPNV